MQRIVSALVALFMLIGASGCGDADPDADAAGTPTTSEQVTTSRAPTTTAAAPTTSSPASSTTATTDPPATTVAPGNGPGTTPSPPPPPPPPPPPAPSTPPPTIHRDRAYTATISWIDGATAARMTHSWRAGCPVPLSSLRLMTLSYWGFDGAAHTGELVVHADVASRVAAAMNTLFQARFPIQRMQLVDVYGGSDDASMAANNTSGFNCRLTTSGSRWSEHSYGRAIDINPVQNPYVSSGGTVLPPAGAPYVDRTRTDPGMIHGGDVVVQAFAAIGWAWGGNFQSIKDWQHFSSTGR